MAVGLVDGLDRTEIRPDTQAPEIQAPVRRADTKRRWGGLLPPRRDAEVERLRQLEGAQAVLERARALIAQGWVQDAFYIVRGRNGESRPVSPFGLLLLTRTDVVGACLVGAVAHASGSIDRRERRGQAALAVDTLWHTLAEDPSYERLPTAPYDAVHPAARAARVRELARWNDEPARTQDEVLGLVDRAVSRTILHSVR
ncbi:MAG TPA: hypothetical protein VNC85_12260 [Mycobacteriales bacterium]|nr:hypothetical protein [Mycobacteriales bacterium]